MDRTDRPTMPPGPDDADADAFAYACRHDEWDARLAHVARLHTWADRGKIEHDQDAE